MNDIIKEINSVVNRYIHSIHTQDKTDFQSLWSGEDTDTMISVTKVYKGTERIYRDFLIDGIQKAYSDIRLIADEVPEIHLLDDNTAVVIFRYHTECIKREDGGSFGIKGMETQIMKNIRGQWKLCHIHYSM